MNSYWQEAIPTLETESLVDLAVDAQNRIGSHVAGGEPTEDYVERQRYLLSLIQEELKKR